MMNLACSRVRICFLGKVPLPNDFHSLVDRDRRGSRVPFDIIDLGRPLATPSSTRCVSAYLIAPGHRSTIAREQLTRGLLLGDQPAAHSLGDGDSLSVHSFSSLVPGFTKTMETQGNESRLTAHWSEDFEQVLRII